jgi:hypothetical protein
VDDKAIEAAAIEEPIPYEPTNVEPKPTEEEKTEEKGEANVNPEDQWEVVEEDAENEVPVPQHAVTTATSARFSAEQQTLWPSYDENQSAEGEFPEPSMEDFFHEMEDPVQAEHGKSLEQGADAAAAGASSGKEAPTKPAEEADSLSLVPNKKTSSTKSKKRPKFRSAPRKKK